jgi:two-component system sensor histidine kinase QseC
MWAHTNGSCEQDSRWQLSSLAFEQLAHEAKHHVPVYFHDCITEAVRSSQPFAHEHDVTFETTLAQSSNSDAAVEVLGDPVLLEVMVANLVGKALRCSPAGSRVELDVQVLTESLVLHVRDHGSGPAACRTGFGSVEASSLEPRSSGSSLDLARRVAEHHHGTVSLDVSHGGCEYCIQLPRWRPEGPPLPHSSRGSA